MLRILLLALAMLGLSTLSALAQDECGFEVDQAVDVEFNSTPELWYPAVVLAIENPGPYCGVVVRFLAGPEPFDPDRVWTVSKSHVRDAQLPRPKDNEAVLDESWTTCPAGGHVEDYEAETAGSDDGPDFPVYYREIARALAGPYPENVSTYFQESEVAGPIENNVDLNTFDWNSEIPVGNDIYRVTTDVVICYQRTQSMRVEAYRGQFYCFIGYEKRWACRPAAIVEHFGEYEHDTVRP